MRFERFELERWQAERTAEVDLSSAGCVRLRYRDVVEFLDLDRDVSYGATQGSASVREKVAALYPEISIHPDQVLITSGTAEANLIVLTTLIERGDEFVLVVPTYLQSAGLARALGAQVKTVRLHEDEGWRLCLDELAAVLSTRTRAVFITNPNNPDGSRLGRPTIESICELAGRVGAYVIADEALKGLEADGVVAPSPAELYERGVCTGSLSKVGLPGIRVGWLVGPRDLVERCWTIKDYTTLSHSGIGEALADVALEPTNVARFRARARAYVREHRAILMDWIENNVGVLSCVAPEAGATAFPAYNYPMESVAFCESVRQEVSVLLSPGDFFGGPKHFRIRFGLPRETLQEGLARLSDYISRHTQLQYPHQNEL